MRELDLNGIWQMTGAGFDCTGTIPGSVCSFLLDKGLMEDPYYRQNELETQKLLKNEFTFSRKFDFAPTGDRVLLGCEGLDTICDIYINDIHVAYTDNMHRTYEFDVTAHLKDGENEIRIVCHPAEPYIKERNAEHPIFGAKESTKGFGHLRKAHCMMGWDWGPRIPDAGIWRNIGLLILDSARITEFHVTQRHEGGRVYVTPFVKTDREAEVTVTVQAPDGSARSIEANQETEIEAPELWWPNRMGSQPLYTFTAELSEDDKEGERKIVDSQEKKIGLRTLRLIREKDIYG